MLPYSAGFSSIFHIDIQLRLWVENISETTNKNSGTYFDKKGFIRHKRTNLSRFSLSKSYGHSSSLQPARAFKGSGPGIPAGSGPPLTQFSSIVSSALSHTTIAH